MPRYTDLTAKAALFGKMKPSSDHQLHQLRNAHPGLPADYIDFLAEIGSGPVGNALMLYGGPIAPDEVYDEATAARLGPLLVLGDDFQGNSFAFDPPNAWRVVFIDSSDMSTELNWPTFERFIRRQGSLLESPARAN